VVKITKPGKYCTIYVMGSFIGRCVTSDTITRLHQCVHINTLYRLIFIETIKPCDAFRYKQCTGVVKSTAPGKLFNNLLVWHILWDAPLKYVVVQQEICVTASSLRQQL